MTKTKPLTPPDLKRCQAEKPNGNSFMTLGGRPGRERCTNVPVVVVTEKELNPEDGQRGSMALCASCYDVLTKQEPNLAVIVTKVEDMKRELKVTIEKKTVRVTEDGIKLDPPLDLFTIELELPSAGTKIGVTWSETFGSRLEVVRFMRGVEAGRALLGDMAPLFYEIPE